MQKTPIIILKRTAIDHPSPSPLPPTPLDLLCFSALENDTDKTNNEPDINDLMAKKNMKWTKEMTVTLLTLRHEKLLSKFTNVKNGGDINKANDALLLRFNMESKQPAKDISKYINYLKYN